MHTVYGKKKKWRRISRPYEGRIRKMCCCLIFIEVVWIGAFQGDQPFVSVERRTKEYAVEWKDLKERNTYGILINWEKGTVEFYQIKESLSH